MYTCSGNILYSTLIVRVLVTGGAGYIGSHAVRALRQAGHHPVVVDNLVYGHQDILDNVLSVPYVIGQVGDKKLMQSVLQGTHPSLLGTVHQNQAIEAIIHFAAYAYVGESVTDPLKYYRNNLGDTFSLLELLVESKQIIPFVFSSTCATYGLPESVPLPESHPQNPINPYGNSKLMVEQILKDFAKAYQFPSVIFRYFNAAGADPNGDLGEDHDPETHLIPRIFDVVKGKQECLEIYGNDYPTLDGTCIRDYIHVTDLADAHVLGLQHVAGLKNVKSASFPLIYNLGNGVGFSVNEVVATVSSITGCSVASVYAQRRAGDPPALVASAQKACRELGWNPRYPDLSTIVEHAWRWHQRRHQP